MTLISYMKCKRTDCNCEVRLLNICNDCGEPTESIGLGDESWDVCESCRGVESCHEAFVCDNGHVMEPCGYSGDIENLYKEKEMK